MSESQVPDVPTPSNPPDEVCRKDDFEKTLKGLYGDVDWSAAAKEYLRASGLV
jgi:hypothetical protein